jgi:hypothetical protein
MMLSVAEGKRAASGHAAADPAIPETKSRRRIAFSKARTTPTFGWPIRPGNCQRRNGHPRAIALQKS